MHVMFSVQLSVIHCSMLLFLVYHKIRRLCLVGEWILLEQTLLLVSQRHLEQRCQVVSQLPRLGVSSKYVFVPRKVNRDRNSEQVIHTEGAMPIN